jgi:hypothetical protein
MKLFGRGSHSDCSGYAFEQNGWILERPNLMSEFIGQREIPL